VLLGAVEECWFALSHGVVMFRSDLQKGGEIQRSAIKPTVVSSASVRSLSASRLNNGGSRVGERALHELPNDDVSRFTSGYRSSVH